MRGKRAVPGAVVAVQTFGDFLGFHPHLHILVSDGYFHENGMFSVIHDEDVIRKILKHLNLWDVKRKPPQRLPVRGTQTGAHASPIDGFSLYDEPPAPSADDYLTDPDYPVEAYF